MPLSCPVRVPIHSGRDGRLQITHAVLEPVEHLSLQESDDAAIHPRFLVELRSRRLARKRRRIPSTKGSSNEDIPTCCKFSLHDHMQQSTNGSPPSTSHAQFDFSGENEPFLRHDEHQPEQDHNDDDERHDQATTHIRSSEPTPVAQPMSQRQTVLDQPCTSTGITHDVQQANLCNRQTWATTLWSIGRLMTTWPRLHISSNWTSTNISRKVMFTPSPNVCTKRNWCEMPKPGSFG